MDDEWRIRLREARDKDGRSMRSISIEAGCSAGYLHGVLEDGKEPGLERFLSICRVLNVSAAYILYGVDLSPSAARLIGLVQSDPEKLKALLALMEQ